MEVATMSPPTTVAEVAVPLSLVPSGTTLTLVTKPKESLAPLVIKPEVTPVVIKPDVASLLEVKLDSPVETQVEPPVEAPTVETSALKTPTSEASVLETSTSETSATPSTSGSNPTPVSPTATTPTVRRRRRRHSANTYWTKRARKKILSPTSTTPPASLPDCCCNNGCLDKVGAEDRARLFRTFWGLGSLGKQRAYLSERVKAAGSPGGPTLEYHLDGTKPGDTVVVCRPFFRSTLAASNRMLNRVVSAKTEEVAPTPKSPEPFRCPYSLRSPEKKKEPERNGVANGSYYYEEELDELDELSDTDSDAGMVDVTPSAASLLPNFSWPKELSVMVQNPSPLLSDPASHHLQPVSCKCWHGCSSKITEQQRQKIFRHFWSLDPTAQQDYLNRQIFEMRKKKTQLRGGKPSRRKYSCEYYLEADGHRYQVCLNYFVKTLDVTINMVRVILKNRRVRDSQPQQGKFVVAVVKSPDVAAHEEESDDYVDVAEKLEIILTVGSEVLKLKDEEQYPQLHHQLDMPPSVPAPYMHHLPLSLTLPQMLDAVPPGTRSARPPRRLEPVECRCWNQCNMKISEKHRQHIFNHFWQLGSYSLQRQFLLQHVVDKKKRCIRSPKGTDSRRKYTCEYYLDAGGHRVQVCQRFFIKTLGISGSLVHLTLRKKRTFGIEMAGVDRRGLWRSLQTEGAGGRPSASPPPPQAPTPLPAHQMQPTHHLPLSFHHPQLYHSSDPLLDTITKNPELEITVRNGSASSNGGMGRAPMYQPTQLLSSHPSNAPSSVFYCLPDIVVRKREMPAPGMQNGTGQSASFLPQPGLSV